MTTWFQKLQNKQYSFQLLGLWLVFSLWTSSLMAQTFENLLPPIQDRTPGTLRFYVDEQGLTNLAYFYAGNNGENEIAYMVQNNDSWSSPIFAGIGFPYGNSYLNDIQTLANGFPLMLLTGDNTDYEALLNLPDGLSDPPTQEELDQLGYTKEVLEETLAENERLFFSLQTNGKWFSPLPIPDTFRATSPVLSTGNDNTALLVFSRDNDKDFDTLNDFELYATVYRAGHWSDVIRLTDNDTVEDSVQATFVNGEYVIIWISDQDNDLETLTDQQLHFATVSPTGQIIQQAQSVTSTSYAYQPMLGQWQNQAILLWASAPNSAEDPTISLWESQFNGTWSPPVKTKLNYSSIDGSGFYQVGNHLLLVHSGIGTLKAALHNGEEWLDVGILIDFDKTRLQVESTSFFRDQTGQLLIGVTGYVPSQESESTEVEGFSGIFFTKLPLLSDLTFSSIDALESKQIGETTELRFVVKNEGALITSNYEVQLKKEGNLLQTFTGNPLLPGQEQAFQYDVLLDKVATKVDFQILSSSPESNQENNIQSYSVSISPDYSLSSITRTNDTTLTAKIKELKGIAAIPVLVKFYLIEGDQLTLIGEGQYNPNSVDPVTIEWPEMAQRQEPFQIYLIINEERTVTEDDYANNTGAYRFNPLPDFEITHFQVTSQNIYLTIQNHGDTTIADVTLLLTDDPSIAIQTSPNGVPALYSQQVSLDENNQAKLKIARSDIDPINSPALYAVVNPYGTVEELDRNNNSARAAAPLDNTGGSEETTLLQIGEITTWCGTIQLQIVNAGTATVIAPKIQLLNASQTAITETVFPVIGVDSTENVKFDNLQIGDYTLRLTYSSMSELQILENQVSLTTNATNCRQIIGTRELSLVNLSINANVSKKNKKGNNPEETEINIEFSVLGFGTSYKKPLVRVPLIIEVKEGTELKYNEEKILFLPETSSANTYTKTLQIPSAVLQPGSRLIVQTPVRDDENTGFDNLLSLEIE